MKLKLILVIILTSYLLMDTQGGNLHRTRTLEPIPTGPTVNITEVFPDEKQILHIDKSWTCLAVM